MLLAVSWLHLCVEQVAVGEPGFLDQFGERGEMIVALDQRGHRADSIQNLLVQRPNGLIDRCAVVIDQQSLARAVCFFSKTCQMNLPYGF